MNHEGHCHTLSITTPSLQRAQGLLLQAKQFLCAGCKRQCQRRLTEFGGQPASCKQR